MRNDARKRRSGQISVPFLLTIVVLLAALGVRPFLKGTLGSQEKLPVPLRKPLAQLDKNALGPYEFEGRAPVNAAVEESLGTDEYITWGFCDTSVKSAHDPLRHLTLHVAYYTGGRDLVPHTPDQCMKGAGYEPTEAANIEIPIELIYQRIPLRVLTFEKSSIMNNETPTVCYTFSVNGKFACTRNGVRREINFLGREHGYFCKIEVSFGSGMSSPRNPTREESIDASQRFLNRLLPVLLKEHLPDWDKVLAAEEAGKQYGKEQNPQGH